MPSEAYVERKFKKWCDDHGIHCLKLAGPPGWPDRTLLMPNGDIVFMEWKAEKGVVSPQQKYWVELLKGLGHKVYVMKSFDEAVQTVMRLTHGHCCKGCGELTLNKGLCDRCEVIATVRAMQ